MQVNLAGYNIDNSLIRKLNTETATPEVISAAYARISRSEKSITELREQALKELEKHAALIRKLFLNWGIHLLLNTLSLILTSLVFLVYLQN